MAEQVVGVVGVVPALAEDGAAVFGADLLRRGSMSAAPEMLRPERISASGMLGVTTSARGSSARLSVSMASSRRSFAPLVATMTGSTTMCFAPYSRSFAAMSSMSPAEETMPILTASG